MVFLTVCKGIYKPWGEKNPKQSMHQISEAFIFTAKCLGIFPIAMKKDDPGSKWHTFTYVISMLLGDFFTMETLQ